MKAFSSLAHRVFLQLKTRFSLCAMGRRKSKRKPPPKKKMTGDLESQFTCPFCNHEKSCDVKMERSRNTGIISCTVCLEEFQTPITYLSEPVDVYSDWIDACEAANQ
ncbi:transcription elongation factor 1 homolog [Anabas testudineus]|uniref:Transcription elongation factor 1 homolog n=1 Tax=Anabas testudineus TaxID=64144 RepID=A0A7N6AR90_ANATE|nr:transcription elongation factor 1 homolog [Anabas testudineus]